MGNLKHPVIKTRDIGVSFGGISVLRDVSIEIHPGEIIGLVGENGAGKSTLGKVLGGYYSASGGSLEIEGHEVLSWDAHIALQHGVAMMHQELQLVPELTVVENVFLGIENHQFGFMKSDEAERLKALLKSSGFSLDPNAVTSRLPIADQQKIEILRALARDAKVLIMDEPTSSLSKDEIINLHEIMAALRKDGRSVIYVSHFLDDILDICDRIVVLRDGDHVTTLIASETEKPQLVSALLGDHKTETLFPPKPPLKADAEILLEVKDLQSKNGVQSASLNIRAGEIVGLAGLVGSGRSEIARAIIGADNATGGTVQLGGQPYNDRSPAASTRHGLVMVPEDRRGQGLVMTIPVRANMTLPHLKEFSAIGLIKSAFETSRVRELIEYFQVRPSSVNGNITHYSGGNQQKVLIGKWLVGNPKVVILDEPSRGVDVGAREKIHQAIVEMAQNGTAVLLISSEIDEVLGLAHRVYLVDHGRILEEMDPSTTDESQVLARLFALQGKELG